MPRLSKLLYWSLVFGLWSLVLATPVRADWLQDLLFGAQTANVTDIHKANQGNMPLVEIIPAREPSPTGQSAQPAQQVAATPAQTDSSSTNELLDLTGGYTVGDAIQLPQVTPVPNDLGNFFQNLLGSLLGIRDYGNERANVYFDAGAPLGAGSQALNIYQKNNQNTASQPSINNSNILGISLFGVDPMVWAYGASQCQKLPLIERGNCTETGTLANLPQVTPTPIEIIPDVSPTPGEIIGICPAGTGFCSESYIRNTLINMLKINPAEVTDAKVKNASQICMKESGGFPFALNNRCDPVKWPVASKRTLDYSMGLFQINALYHCPLSRPTIIPSPPTCRFGSVSERDKCVTSWANPVENIRQMWRISSGGTNWKPWSAAKVCGITVSVTPSPPPVQIVGCPNPASRIWVPNTQYKKLDQSLGCMRPSLIVIHWSAAWTDAEATFNTLNIKTFSRPWLHGCQFATDKNHQLQMQDFWTNAVVWGYCVGGTDNARSLNDEITGAYFDDLVDNNYQLITTHPRYTELKAETDRSIATTCWALRQYNIPKSNVIGHFESSWGASSGKIDPGVKYIRYYRNRVNNECR